MSHAARRALNFAKHPGRRQNPRPAKRPSRPGQAGQGMGSASRQHMCRLVLVLVTATATADAINNLQLRPCNKACKTLAFYGQAPVAPLPCPVF